MKKSILHIGSALSKAEQQQINGGSPYNCGSQYSQQNCDEYCHSLMLIYSNGNNDPDSRDNALDALENRCGVEVIGDDNVL